MSRFPDERLRRFSGAASLLEHAAEKLAERVDPTHHFPEDLPYDPSNSAVLFLLGNGGEHDRFDPCLILNKRSPKVRQPGDLCCPGGSIASRLDPLLAKIVALPGLPLSRWPYWPAWRDGNRRQAGLLALIVAACLRESWEEMRLNPWNVTVIGPMPVQRLVMFKREIFPVAGWVRRQKRFFPNWEVEKVVRLPLASLLNPDNYGRYRLQLQHTGGKTVTTPLDDYPCFVHRDPGGTELLWGATYRIVVRFLDDVFEFKPPSLETLPIVSGVLDKTYAMGSSIDR